MATPSSKQNPGATPTHLTTSPRPSGGNPMARTMSHKSPSARTPSVSGHGHGTSGALQLNTSTHQYSTPVAAATAGIDDPVTFSSPSALLALGGYSGVSPSPAAAHDALGLGSGMNDHDIHHALGMQGLKLGGNMERDSDEERRRHVEDVVQLLRTRVAGRGVCREGIERLGQLEGFESIWQEDNLSIAGNFVDLEIEFHPASHSVNDVSLKYATPEATEGERRDEATAVLRRDLIQSPEEMERGAWKSLDGFCENLRWLAKLDRLSQEVNCFEAIEGLYESMKRVWDEEGKLPQFAGLYGHLCNGWMGRPYLHRGDRIGMGLDYWVHQASVLDAGRKQTSPDAMVLDHPDQDDAHGHKMWSVIIECEEGYPSLRVSRDWVRADVLTSANTDDKAPNKNATPDIPIVNWADPPPTTNSENQGDSDAMALDSTVLDAPNRRFTAKIEPPLNVPILAASDIYRHLDLQLPQEFRMVTYDGLLVPGLSPLSATDALGLGGDESFQTGRRKRRMSVQAYDSDGKPCKKQHSYTFQAFESVAGRTMRDIPFSHPRQLADIFPILRQYAFLANMIHKIFDPSSEVSDLATSTSLASDQPAQPAKPKEQEKSGVTVLSNRNPNEQKLNALLKGFSLNNNNNENAATASPTDQGPASDDVKIDITLRTQLGHSPVIMLLFTFDDNDALPATSATDTEQSRVSISFEVGLNGRITVIDTSGLWNEPRDGGDDQKDKGAESELPRKIARALEISQDLGILVEWVLRWRRQRKKSA